jgi:DNA gyrase/topoisomerase IV subunit A
MTVLTEQDIFILTKASKVIRFSAFEVPPTDGVVQGVNCVALRQDEVVGLVNS